MPFIKILTIHDIGNNFGSTLQACALCNFLEENGYTVELVDYKPRYAYHHGRLASLTKYILFPKSKYIQDKRFKKFFDEHVKKTKRYNNYEELCHDEMPDIYLVGSDQVWNEFYNAGKDPAYYLEFTSCQKKMAYSTSLGQLHSKEELLRIKERTKNFSAIGVREKASAIQLHSIGMDGVVHVLDPVFLFEKEYYVNSCFRNKYGKYVLVYSVNNDALMEKISILIAHKYKAKIVLVGGFTQKNKHDIYLRDIGPAEFSNLINNAEFVISNSFHATAMSIILHKQFAVVLSKLSPLRITDLLETTGLENRVVRNERDIENVCKPIEYSVVEKKLNPLKIKSKEFLLENLSILSSCNKEKENNK